MSDDDEFLAHINLEQICEEAKQKEEEKRFVEVSSGEIDELLSNVLWICILIFSEIKEFKHCSVVIL